MKRIKKFSPILLLGLLITSLFFVNGCLATTPEGETEGDFLSSIWPMLIFLVVIFVLMYFVMIRPQRKRQQEQQNMLQELQKGDRVITAGGIYGQIESISEENAVLKIESGATIRIARSSIIGKQSEETKIG